MHRISKRWLSLWYGESNLWVPPTSSYFEPKNELVRLTSSSRISNQSICQNSLYLFCTFICTLYGLNIYNNWYRLRGIVLTQTWNIVFRVDWRINRRIFKVTHDIFNWVKCIGGPQICHGVPDRYINSQNVFSAF